MNVIEQEVQTLRIAKTELIAASPEIVWESILHNMGPDTEFEPGAKFKMTLEAFPGGRWWRDLGNGSGHLWAHVQVIKPNKILELCGPLFMSFAVSSHLQYKLTADGAKTRLDFLHTAVGLIPADLSTGLTGGWGGQINGIRTRAERSAR